MSNIFEDIDKYGIDNNKVKTPKVIPYSDTPKEKPMYRKKSLLSVLPKKEEWKKHGKQIGGALGKGMLGFGKFMHEAEEKAQRKNKEKYGKLKGGFWI